MAHDQFGELTGWDLEGFHNGGDTELWKRLGHPETLTYEPWPVADESLLVADTVTCVVQVKGKVRARLEVPADIDDASLEAAALAEPRIADLLAGQTIRKVIVRAPNLVNIVAG